MGYAERIKGERACQWTKSVGCNDLEGVSKGEGGNEEVGVRRGGGGERKRLGPTHDDVLVSNILEIGIC
jgi:hypothetical protein